MPGAWVDEEDHGSLTSKRHRNYSQSTLSIIADKTRINVPEFRNANRYTRPDRSKPKRLKTTSGRKSVSEDGYDGLYELQSDPIETSSISSSIEEISAEALRKDLGSDGEKLQQSSPTTDISPHARLKSELQVLIPQTLDIASRKRKVYVGEEGSTKRLRRRSSPDPLNADQTTEDSSAVKTSPVSQSLSQRGSLKRTPFSSTKINNQKKTNESARTKHEHDVAMKIVGQHFEVVAGVSGDFKFETSDSENSARKCFLRLQAVSTLILPGDETGSLMEGYEYLGVNLDKVLEVSLSEPISSIVAITRSLTPSCPALLTLKLASVSQVEDFKKWIFMERCDISTPKFRLVTS